MSRRARSARVVLTSVVVAVLLAGCASNETTRGTVAPGGQTRIVYDDPALRVPAGDVAGDSLSTPVRRVGVADFPGQVVVLNVWGSWCGPCRGEADDLERVAAATAPAGVRFLGVNVRDDRAAAGDFIRSFGVTYPSLFDPSGRSLLSLRGVPRNVVPATIVLDRSHRVAAVFLAAVLDTELRPVVDRIATEPAPRP